MFNKKNRILKTQIKELAIQNKLASDGLAAGRETLAKLKKDSAKILENARNIEKERDKLKEMVRDQNNADLLLNALKATGIIAKEKPYDFQGEYNRLAALQQQLGGMTAFLHQGLYGSPLFGREY